MMNNNKIYLIQLTLPSSGNVKMFITYKVFCEYKLEMKIWVIDRKKKLYRSSIESYVIRI